METLAREFHGASATYNGHLLAASISPFAPPSNPTRLEAVCHSSRSATVKRDASYALTRYAGRAIVSGDEALFELWSDIHVAYWHTVAALMSPGPADDKVYEAWRDLANVVIKGYSSNLLENWTLPVLYAVGKYLRLFALRADEGKKVRGGQDAGMAGLQDDIASDSGANEKLEDAARVLNRMFTLCLGDRAPLQESRKWGLYYIANLLFKTYFRLNSISLSKNILRAISASRTDMPDPAALPKSHIVTFEYYVGVLHFLEERYPEAEENLTRALSFCHRQSHANKQRILTYLIPTRLITSRKLPSAQLLAPYPSLAFLFEPFKKAVRSGSLYAFDAALAAGETAFAKRRIFLTLERGRDICLRNLLRKVYLNAGIDEQGNRRTRIRVDEFGAGISLSESLDPSITSVAPPITEAKRVIEGDEVECLLANMIYKNLMKGYISRAHGVVVLSKNGAFPGTGI